MPSISLPSYSATVESGALDRVGEIARAAARVHRWVVITDETVRALYAARAAASLGGASDVLAVPPGEREKTRARWSELTDAMLAAGCGRDTGVVALGGGVVGDLAGFVAATFMRGIPVVQVPTTLLAMIDASIGGKTGVDTSAGKNLVGAFHDPVAVVADPGVLATLAERELRAGLAEAIKHGVVADPAYLERTLAELPQIVGAERGGPEADGSLERLVARSIEIKADVVRRDAREAGVRKVLNFGHTVGHAVEALSGWALLHGEAVAIGMVAESGIAERIGVAERGTRARVREAVERAGLPTSIPRAIEAEAIVSATRGDKKARAGSAEYALPAAVGRMAGAERGWALPVDDAAVLEVLREERSR
jgi:3-dehydroquinate synthase